VLVSSAAGLVGVVIFLASGKKAAEGCIPVWMGPASPCFEPGSYYGILLTCAGVAIAAILANTLTREKA